MRQAIPPEERLIATYIRFLATGRSYEDMKFSTGIDALTLSYLIPATCKAAMFDVFKKHYLKIKINTFQLQLYLTKK